MKQFTPVVLLLLLLASCLGPGDTACCQPEGSYALSPHLFVERYHTFCAGVFGDGYTFYLTDSASFRAAIATGDEHGFVRFAVDGDTLRLFHIETAFDSDTLRHVHLSPEQLAAVRARPHEVLLQPLLGAPAPDCDVQNSGPDSSSLGLGYWLLSSQYHCHPCYTNELRLVDSRGLNLRLGYEWPGENPSFFPTVNSDGSIDIYETSGRGRADTLRRDAVALSTLRRSPFRPPCAKATPKPGGSSAPVQQSPTPTR